MLVIKAIKALSLYVCFPNAVSPVDLWAHPSVLHIYPCLPGKDEKNAK